MFTCVITFLIELLSTRGVVTSNVTIDGFNLLLGLIFFQVSIPYYFVLSAGGEFYDAAVGVFYGFIISVFLIGSDYLKWSKRSVEGLMLCISWPCYVFHKIHNVAYYGRFVNWFLCICFTAGFALTARFSGFFKRGYDTPLTNVACGVFGHLDGILFALEIFSFFSWFTKVQVEDPVDHKSIKLLWARDLANAKIIGRFHTNLMSTQSMFNNFEIEVRNYMKSMVIFVKKFDEEMVPTYTEKIDDFDVEKNNECPDKIKINASDFLRTNTDRLLALSKFSPRVLSKIWSRKKLHTDRILILTFLLKRGMSLLDISDHIDVSKSSVYNFFSINKDLVEDLMYIIPVV